MPATAAAARRVAAARASAPAPLTRPRPAPRPTRRPAAPRRTAPARTRTTRARRRGVPALVGHAATAVAGLADSGLVFRLTRGRLWIGLLTALLVGIVALNVMALSLSASATRVGQQADVLDRQNSALRARIASGLSNDRVQNEAQKLGYVVPEGEPASRSEENLWNALAVLSVLVIAGSFALMALHLGQAVR